MSNKKARIISLRSFFAVVLPVSFLAVAAIAASTVAGMNTTLEKNTPSSIDGVPSSWSHLKKNSIVESETTARIIGNDHVEYVASLKNNSDSDTFSVTHLASYINGNARKGFIPLSENSLEYTYSPSNPSSWTPVSISGPKDQGFALEYNLYIGHKDSNTGAIYFRYNVNVADDDGLVDDIVSFIIENGSDKTIVSSSATIDYVTEVIPEEISWAEDTKTATPLQTAKDDESGEFAEPLGVQSETPTARVLSLSHLGTVSLSSSIIAPSIIIICTAVAIFVICLCAYLVRHRTRPSKNHSTRQRKKSTKTKARSSEKSPKKESER